MSYALKLRRMLGVENAHRVFNMNCSCIGMLLGLDIAAGYMQRRKAVKKALLVGSMHVSSVVKYKDSVVYPTFGDWAAAVVLETVEEEKKEEYCPQNTIQIPVIMIQ